MFKVLPLIVASGAILGPGAANALTIQLEDLSTHTIVTVLDGDSLDAWDPQGTGPEVDGVVQYSGSVDGWIINVTTGLSKPALREPQLDLNSVNVSGGSGSLRISVWDDGYSTMAPGFIGAIGGTTNGVVEVTYAVGGNTTDVLSYGSGAFSGTADLNGPNSDNYRMGVDAIIHHDDGTKVTSFDTTIQPVPIPAAAWLFGSALAGIITIGRRRKTRPS